MAKVLTFFKTWGKVILIGLAAILLIVIFRTLKFSPLKFIGWLRGLLKPAVSESNPEKADKVSSETLEKSIANPNDNAAKMADKAISNIDKLLEELK